MNLNSSTISKTPTGETPANGSRGNGRQSRPKLIKWILLIVVLLAAAGASGLYLFYRHKQTPYAPTESKMELAKRMIAGTHSSTRFDSRMPYRLFQPDQLTSEKKYPLVLWLHGSGGRGDDNTAQLGYGVKTLVSDEIQQANPSYVLAPQCPKGHQWLEIDDSKGPPFLNYTMAEIPESHWVTLIVDLIAQLISEHNVDPDRIYVMGFSMGSSGAWDIIGRYPNLFAAAVPMSGRSDPSIAKEISHIPIWAFHGKLDRAAPIANTQKMAAALKEVGGQMTTSELLWGHTVTRYAFSNPNLFKWLFSQRKK